MNNTPKLMMRLFIYPQDALPLKRLQQFKNKVYFLRYICNLLDSYFFFFNPHFVIWKTILQKCSSLRANENKRSEVEFGDLKSKVEEKPSRMFE